MERSKEKVLKMEEKVLIGLMNSWDSLDKALTECLVACEDGMSSLFSWSDLPEKLGLSDIVDQIVEVKKQVQQGKGEVDKILKDVYKDLEDLENL